MSETSIKPVVGKHYTNHVKDLVEIISIDKKNDSVTVQNYTENCKMTVRLSKLILKTEVKKRQPKGVAKQLAYKGPKW
jgi:hypothetical protein